MNVELIRNRLHGGFKPFTLYLSDGRRYDVPHPEFIMVTRRSVVVANERGLVDILDPLHIVSIKELELPEDHSKS
jgi:hypothetical protein